MTAQTISCLRAPSDGLRKLLMPGGFLEPLMALNGRKFNGAELDVHFRINDEVQVYCGLTVILAVKRLQRPVVTQFEFANPRKYGSDEIASQL